MVNGRDARRDGGHDCGVADGGAVIAEDGAAENGSDDEGNVLHGERIRRGGVSATCQCEGEGDGDGHH